MRGSADLNGMVVNYNYKSVMPPRGLLLQVTLITGDCVCTRVYIL